MVDIYEVFIPILNHIIGCIVIVIAYLAKFRVLSTSHRSGNGRDTFTDFTMHSDTNI